MKSSITALLLLLLTIIATAQSAVLRGQSPPMISGTRLFRVAKKNKAKQSSSNNNKLSSGSAGAASNVVKNKKKCKKKKVKSNSIAVKSGDTAGSSNNNNNNGGAMTVTKTTVAPKTTTTATTLKSTSSTINLSNGGSAVTTATKTTIPPPKTTTIPPKTTTKTTPFPDDFFAAPSTAKAATTTPLTTTKATIDGLAFSSNRAIDTTNAAVVKAEQPAWEWIDICNPDGTLIPPNTFAPTISPDVDDWNGWLNVDQEEDDEEEDGSTVGMDGSVETNDNDETNDNIADDTTASITSSPVSSPSQAPVAAEINTDDDDYALSSPGCSAFQNNQVYTTSLPTHVSFLYEISVDADNATATNNATNNNNATTTDNDNVPSILKELERRQVQLVGSNLIRCELFTRRLLLRRSLSSRTRQKRQLEECAHVDGIDASPDDTLLPERECTFLPPSNTNTTTTTCHVVRGRMTLYLRENSTHSEGSVDRALELLENEFDREDSPFLPGEEYGVEGLRGIRYITADDSDSEYVTKGEVPTINVGGAVEETENTSGESEEDFTSVGIALISVGAVALVSILVLATKLGRESLKNGGKDRTYAEFYEDENDLDKEWGGTIGDDNSYNDKTAESVSSNDSPNRGLAIIEGDESIYTHGTASTILRELTRSEAAARAHDIGRDEDSTVYQRPIFLKTDEGSQGMEIYTIGSTNRSIYTRNSSVERPRFENPARLKGNRREYVVDDTVEF